MKDIIKKYTCRLCNSKKLSRLFNLCKTPLANNLAFNKNSSLTAKKFPLNLMICNSCKHVQLEHVVNANNLYKKYFYMSGISASFTKHFENFANELSKNNKKTYKTKVLEIGSNDCTLLNFFKKNNCITVGIEPAKNLWIKTKYRHHIINGFYNSKINNTLKKKYGFFDIIVANNVFAHIDNLKLVFNLLKKVMHQRTIIVVEISYLLDVIKKNLFDTIYHEHLDYHSIKPINQFLKSLDLKIINIKKLNIHGGSVRLYITKTSNEFINNKKILNKLLQEEKNNGLYKKLTYKKFFKDLYNQKKNLKNFFTQYKNYKIYGYGAPAKAVTLINFFQLNHNNINLLVDDSKIKQKKYIPGTEIKIYDAKVLESSPPDIIMILAWNVYEDIIKKIKKYKKIKFAIVPLPKFKVIKL